MVFKDFRKYFSSSRVNRYYIVTGNSASKSVKLYKANLKIAQAFHPILGVLEVVLRNRLNDILAAFFTDPDWIINQKTGFMQDPSLTVVDKKTGVRKTNKYLLTEITKAEKRLNKSRTPVTSGKIIAEQTFGFWTDLFENHHYKLLKGKPIQIFTTLPSGVGRKEVNDAFDKIRRFRNRINHNEPICFSGTALDFTNTIEVYTSMLNILTWIDPTLIEFIKDLDKVNNTINSAQKI